MFKAVTLELQCLQRVVSPGARVALQPRQLYRTLANFMMPPAAREGVDTIMLRVWSPVSQGIHSLMKMLREGSSFMQVCSHCTSANAIQGMQATEQPGI